MKCTMPSSSASPSRRRFPLALAALLPLACGRAPAEVEFELVPSLLVHEPGELGPGSAEWNEAAFDGWKNDPGAGLVWALVRDARVRLAVTDSVDRTVVLELRTGARARGEQAVAVELNGVALATLQVGSEAQVFEVLAPAAAWTRGTNILHLRSVDVGEQAGEPTPYFGLARLRYSEKSRRITKTGEVVQVPPGCGFEYTLEVPVPSELRLELETEAAGELEVRVGQARQTLTIPAGRSRQALALAAEADPMVLGVQWTSAGEPLHLLGAKLADRKPFRRPSVLFVSIDTLSAQHMSLHGYARDTTPELRRLAADFVVFEQARANAPWTIPSYMSQFTGLLPGAHMLDFSDDPEHPPETWELHQLAPNRTTMAEFFRALGYRTAAFVDNPWLARGFGFEQGFELRDAAAAEIPPEDPEGGLRFTVPRALAWLDALPEEQPFFLFVQAFDPHAPYTPTAPWKGKFRGDELWQENRSVPVGQDVAFAYGCIPGHVAVSFVEGAAPAKLDTAPIEAAYDEKILEVDAALATLIAGLKERELYDELLIVISADHGESTTGHDFYFGHALLYADVLHVPLLLRLPGGEGAGRRVRDLVQMVDLYPTLIDYVRGTRRGGIHGESLLPILRDGAASRGYAYAEWGMMEQASAEHDGWKLIASRPRYARYQTQITSPRLDRAALGALIPELATGFPNDERVAQLLHGHPEALSLLESLQGPFFELYRVAHDPEELREVGAENSQHVERLLALIAEGRRLGQEARAGAESTASVEPDAEALAEIDRLGYGGK
jgi:arylsulfatase